MEYIALIGTVTLIHLLAVMSPGPVFIVVLKNALTHSRKAGIWTSVGASLGECVHIFYCIAGLAIIISKSILAFNVIKILGAVYLIYIGLKSIFSKSPEIKIESTKNKKEISAFQAIKMGLLTQMLNPKATLFFLGLFTLVISPDTPNSVLAILSLIIIINTVLWFSFVSIFFTQRKIQAAFNKFQGIFNKIMGGLLITLGIKVALSQSD